MNRLSVWRRTLMLFSVLLLSACGGGGSSSSGGGSSSSVNVVGTLEPGDYQVAQAEPKSFFGRFFSPVQSAYATLADGIVDKIIAIPVLNGAIHGNQMNASVSATVADDGSFSLSLSKSYDWVLILMDTTALTPEEKFAGYIALKATDLESLISLPVIDATVNSIDIGAVVKNGDTGVGDNAANPVDFSLTAEELLALASNDDLFKAAQNLALNYKDGIYYALRPDFVWSGTYSALENNFVDVANYMYEHYEFTLGSNDTGFAMDDVCANGVPRVDLEFYPPTGEIIVTTSGTYTDGAPMSNSNATCSTSTDGTVYAEGTDFFASEGENGDVTLEFGTAIRGSIPAGYWSYQVGGLEKGVFEAAVASPLTATDKIMGFAPSIKVNTDDVGKAMSVDVKWYQLNSAGTAYEELTNISLLKHHIESGDIFFDNSSGAERKYESIQFDPATQTSVTPSNTWYYGTNGMADEQAESFGIFYSSAGTGYFFRFFRP
jgi:hypothetical protein